VAARVNPPHSSLVRGARRRHPGRVHAAPRGLAGRRGQGGRGSSVRQPRRHAPGQPGRRRV